MLIRIKNIKKTKLKYDGIIFLPNFFESQREWES